MKHYQTERGIAPSTGWSSTAGSTTPRRRLTRRFGSVLLLLPLIVGILGAPASPQAVKGDELADARARQAQIKKDVATQKAEIAKLAALQVDLASAITNTTTQLRGINADLTAVKVKISSMQTKINTIKSVYAGLVSQLTGLDAQLTVIAAQEVAKKGQLAERKALLADRVRSAYDTDRTSLLESFLSGGTFTDLLAEASYFIDVGEQDKALAAQIALDQQTLAALHQATDDTRTRTNDLRQATAAQKRALDASLAGLNAAKAQLKLLEHRTAVALNTQKVAFATIARNKAAAKVALARSAAAQAKLKSQIASLIAKQMQSGHIPSAYNGTLSWPMAGDVTQQFGCTGFAWEPAYGSCAHFHQGIDIVAPYGTPVHAAGGGTVVYIGWNYADGADPAWIVIVAHSQGLQTWYAHMSPTYPGGITAGSYVSAGQVIGYEASTGHSTGAHLHWAVMLDGTFVNPRLFL
ncbi:MAG TPA: peptidoglycan DD-metalloendopeptidase family protein [Candidatus Limnocylindrales bacterium]|nr:peptidoglycan DD-metalloendopeptidase family protein [Candidatus Limnocylindrales bacterium]